MDDVIRCFIDLALHLDWLLLVLGHFDPKDPEVRPSEIQSDKVTLFCVCVCGGMGGGCGTNNKRRKELQTCLEQQASRLTLWPGLKL